VAQPIAFHAPAKPAPANMERLRNAPAEHAEALLSAYELLQLLHDRGALNLLRGLVGGGSVVRTAVTPHQSLSILSRGWVRGYDTGHRPSLDRQSRWPDHAGARTSSPSKSRSIFA